MENETINLNPYFVDYNPADTQAVEVFQNKIETIPERLFDLLISDKVVEKIKFLVSKFNMPIENNIELSRIIRDIALGDLYIGDTVQNLQTRLSVDPGTATQIFNEMAQDLFEPFKVELETVQTTKFKNKPFVLAQIQQTTAASPNLPQGSDLPETGGNIIDLRKK